MKLFLLTYWVAGLYGENEDLEPLMHFFGEFFLEAVCPQWRDQINQWQDHSFDWKITNESTLLEILHGLQDLRCWWYVLTFLKSWKTKHIN